MIYGKIWCVVKPSVGIPLFLGAVATIALLVHFSILTHTTWMAAYWEGKPAKAAATQIESSSPPVAMVAPAKP
jgi:light-harvesting protein B-800-850 alpha chain